MYILISSANSVLNYEVFMILKHDNFFTSILYGLMFVFDSDAQSLLCMFSL